MKPLNAEEIAILRKELDPTLETLGDDLAPGWSDLAARALDEVERSRALLKRIEWSGTVVEEARGGCPCCDSPADYHGHVPGCELAALIGGTP